MPLFIELLSLAPAPLETETFWVMFESGGEGSYLYTGVFTY